MLAAGLFLLAACVALAIVALTGGDDSGGAARKRRRRDRPRGRGHRLVHESRTPPGNVAVGEGAVWVLNNEDRTVSRIDPETKEVTQTFGTRGVPSELAVGAGALWVGTAGAGRENRDQRDGQRLTARSRLAGGSREPCGSEVTRACTRSRARRGSPWAPVRSGPRTPTGACLASIPRADGSSPRSRRVRRMDDRSRRGGRLVPRPTRHDGGHGSTRGRTASRRRSRWAPAACRAWPSAPARCGRLQGTGRCLADRARAAADPQDDRRREGSELRRLRRGRGLDGQLRRRHGRPDRSAHEQGHREDLGRRSPGARGRRRRRLGQRGGRDDGGRPHRRRLRRGRLRGWEPRTS